MPRASTKLTIYRPSSYIYICSGIVVCSLLVFQFTDSLRTNVPIKYKQQQNNQKISKPTTPATTKENSKENTKPDISLPLVAQEDEDKQPANKNQHASYMKPFSKEITGSSFLTPGKTESLQWDNMRIDIMYRKHDIDGRRFFTIAIQNDQQSIKKNFGSYDSISSISMADLNANDKPELYITWVSDGSGAYAAIEGYEIMESTLKAMSFPQQPQGKGYMGHDRYVVYQDYIEHSYPVYTEHDTNNVSSGGTAYIRYQFRKGKYKARSTILR